MLNIIVFLAIGLIAGWLASVLVRGRGLGAGGDIVVGIIGSLIGGLLFGLLGLDSSGSLIGQIIVATVGAIIALGLVKTVRQEHV